MKKLINDIPSVVRQSLEGLVALNPHLALLEGENTVLRADIASFRKSGKVAILTGGGAGHEPAHAGYVGKGMLTVAVSGDVFASPSTDAVYAGLKAVAGPAGILIIVKNYTGDRLNFGLAAEMARAEGIAVEMVVVDDDASLGSAEKTAGRRGIAGTVFVHKLAGAAAEAGKTLAEVAAVARNAISLIGSMGVALSPCTVPAAGKANFELGENEMELGLGIHGEAGVRRIALASSRQIVDTLLDTIVSDRQLTSGQSVVLLVNNLGATPVMEMGIVTADAMKGLAARGLMVERAYSGTFLTAIDMAGVSLSLMAVDAEIVAGLDAATDAPAWPRQASSPVAAMKTIAGDNTSAAVLLGTGPAVSESFLDVLSDACNAIIAAEPALTEMDRVVGDGDIGHSLAGGATQILRHVAEWRGQPIDSVLHHIGLTLRRAVGGTSGPLYAAFAIAAGQQLKSGAADVDALRKAFSAGTDAIIRLGGAAAGDRTMVDALLPAKAAMDAAPGNIAALLQVAATGARKGAEGTVAMPPRRGRSSYIGQRAIGHPDPGAVAVALWLEAAAKSVERT